jgi:hypothetical protein
MSLLYRLFCGLLGLLARRGGQRELEIIVLRQQLAIFRRGGKRPQYTIIDRALLAAASRLLPPERWSCFLAVRRRFAAGIVRSCGETGERAVAGSAVRRLPLRSAP